MKANLVKGMIAFALSMLISTAAIADTGGVQVSGTAKISAVPDIARFSFAVNGRGKLLPALKRDVDSKTAAVIALCRQLGVSNKHITAAQISIHPQYNHQTRELTGYNLSRNISVELHQLDQYTALVNGAIDSGITTINNISMEVEDRDLLEAQALAAAVKAAGKKAEIIARNAGIELGRIISINETGSNFDNRRYESRQVGFADAAVSNVFEPGEIAVTATVTVVYAIP
ncbi:MAG: hypothetical protein ACI9LO_000840 [Planctomycetota bacterium]|jgi:uncharacterized protein YggE